MSLYSMLPEAKNYLMQGGFSTQSAGFLLMACFVSGFMGIQVISRLFHQFLPSHVVDCDHSHKDQPPDHPTSDEHHDHGHAHHGHDHHRHRHSSRARSRDGRSHSLVRNPSAAKAQPGSHSGPNESTPLLPSIELPHETQHTLRRSNTVSNEHLSSNQNSLRSNLGRAATTQERRPSMVQVQKRVMSFVKDTKPNCDEGGPCFGYTDPCGQECFKHLNSRSAAASRAPTFMRTTTGFHSSHGDVDRIVEDDASDSAAVSPTHRSRTQSRDRCAEDATITGQTESPEDLEAQHHHHVPENAFLSIGLQTSIAIALHKFPEGFITYATNHANPSLGFSVFLALFVHNISEGFAMALPLYMALHSRPQAMFWSSVLGGLSQPLGAGVAVLWFKLASHTHMTPDATAYGCLFAITSGIMASVALQLFIESLSLNHNRNLGMFFAFLGMTLLGVSSAFTGDEH